MPYRTSRADFERHVEAALKTLPEEYRKYFENITIIVQDRPGREQLKGLNPEGILLGLFSGVPYPRKGGFFELPHPFPDRIVLFQKNIEQICENESELVEQIRKTLVHEIGHYFGLSEDDLRRYE